MIREIIRRKMSKNEFLVLNNVLNNDDSIILYNTALCIIYVINSEVTYNRVNLFHANVSVSKGYW